MGKMKQSLLAIMLFAVLVGLGVAALVWRTGYTISEMDWNSDGTTSPAEMLHAIDVGRRPIKSNGVDCQEFFNMKDGLPIRVDCLGDAESNGPGSK